MAGVWAAGVPHPLTAKQHPCSIVVMAVAAYSTVSGGSRAGSAQILLGSPLLPLQFSAAVAVFL